MEFKYYKQAREVEDMHCGRLVRDFDHTGSVVGQWLRFRV